MPGSALGVERVPGEGDDSAQGIFVERLRIANVN